MKITYIMPCVGKKSGQSYIGSWLMEPLAIATLAGLTPKSYDRVFYDDRIEDIPFDEPTDIVAINVETFTARRAYQIAKKYRRRGVKVVMGGFHATLVPDEVIQYADAVVVGEAEITFGKLLQDLAYGRMKRVYRALNGPDLTGIVPDRSIYSGKQYMKLSLVETGRGCRFSCDFCSIASFFQNSYRARPVQDVIDEILRLNNRDVFFVDDNIAVDPKRARELFEALIPLRLRWVGQISINAARDEAMLTLMRRSGCAGVLVGLESLQPDSLEAMGKTVNNGARDYALAMTKFREYGLGVYATFVFGYDTDTRVSCMEALEFAQRHRHFFAAFNNLIPFPGTRLYGRLKSEGRLIYQKWWLSEDYRFGDVPFVPANFSPEGLAMQCLECRKEFYGFRSVMKRGLDLKANCRTPEMALLYFIHNFSNGRDILRRQGLPLGFSHEEL